MKTKKITRYIKRMKAYVDEDNWVWERNNHNGYTYNGLTVRKNRHDKVGIDVKDKDMIVAYDQEKVLDVVLITLAHGKIDKRDVLVNNLLA